MEQLRKFIAGICAILFIGSGITALFLFNIERQAFSIATYQQAFEQQNLYQHMPEVLADALHTSIAENVNADPYLKTLTVQDWRTTISALIPPNELKAFTNKTLVSVFDYLNNKTDTVTISLLPFKNQLAGPGGVDFAKQILKAQPDCTANQLLQMGLGLFGGDIRLCNPPAEAMSLITPLINAQLQSMTVTIPNEITLISNRTNTTNDPRIKLNRVRALMKASPFFPLFFLFALSVFAIRNLIDWLQWWGYPFLITSVISSLLAYVGSPIFIWVVERILQKQIGSFLPPVLFSTLMETVSGVASQILKPVVFEGLGIAILGLGMIVAVAWHKIRQSKRIRAVSG
jgi:hypothetical protein